MLLNHNLCEIESVILKWNEMCRTLRNLSHNQIDLIHIGVATVCHWISKLFLGPTEWHKAYPIAQGSRQSPIDIVPGSAAYDANMSPISLFYDNCTSINISNNGHSVVVEFVDIDDRSGWWQHLLLA